MHLFCNSKFPWVHIILFTDPGRKLEKCWLSSSSSGHFIRNLNGYFPPYHRNSKSPPKCLYSAASCIASPSGSRGKNGACHFIFQSPWWSLVKLLMGNPTVSSWPLYSSAGSEPSQGFAGQERRPMKPEEFPHFDVGPRRKKRLVLNSLLWKCSFVSPLLRRQTCFYLGLALTLSF